MTTMAEFIRIANLGELPAGTMQTVDARGRRLLLINLDGQVHALDARCPHRGGPLEEGELCQRTIACPWHHYRYDVGTAENVYPRNVYPADLRCVKQDLRPVQYYPVRIARDEIWVRA
jgi:3-phenylpropionate/trans-cinnamate dioxygenase ferredoxin subunit